jgi:hypothetical protein
MLQSDANLLFCSADIYAEPKQITKNQCRFKQNPVAEHTQNQQTNNTRSTNKEHEMSALAGLKLIAAKRPQAAPPMVQRRNKLSNQLFQQIELARCLSEGKTYAPTRLRNIKDKHTGERRTVEAVKRVRQWWFVSDTGKVCLQVRYGTRVMELARGKNSIEVANAAELLNVLSAVKSAVEAGELDAQIDAASAAVRERFSQ